MRHLWSRRLRALFFPRPREAQRPRAFRPRAEPLEDRTVLSGATTSTVFLDFGDAFPNGILPGMVQDFDDAAAGVHGPRLFRGSNPKLNHFNDNVPFALENFDLVTNTDAGKRAAIVQQLAFYFEPFEITILSNTASNLSEVSTLLAGDPTASYLFIGRLGIAEAGQPVYYPAEQDYVGVYPETDVGMTNTNPGTGLILMTGAVSESDEVMARRIARGAGILLGLSPSFSAEGSTLPSSLLHQSDIMSSLSRQSSDITRSAFFTHFPQVIAGSTNNNALATPDLGLDDDDNPIPRTPANQLFYDDAIGANPNLTYITGTGAHDTITITPTGLNQAMVTVAAFSDEARTVPLTVPGSTATSFSYLIPLDLEIRVDGGAGDDWLILPDAGPYPQLRFYGGPGDDTLSGADVLSTWSIVQPNQGDINGFVSFFDTENLIGGALDDAFVLVGDPAAGGGSLAGSITGGGAGTNGNVLVGNDFGITFTITTFNAGTVAEATGDPLVAGGFRNIGTLVGGDAADRFVFGIAGFLGLPNGDPGIVDGGDDTPTSSNTVVGDPHGYTFTIDGANSGNVRDTVTTPAFLLGAFFLIQNLEGNSNNDTFRFEAGGSLSGDIDGQGVSATPIGMNPVGNTITVASDVAVTFTVDVANGGLFSLLGGRFTGIQNLYGGAGADTFAFAGGSLAGLADGGSGADVLNFAAAASQQVNLAAVGTTDGYNGTLAATSLLAGGFFNMNGVIGSTAGTTDTLRGTNAASTWIVSDVNEGSYASTFDFLNVENLTGGTAGDSFFFAGGSLAGRIDGGDQLPTGNTIFGDDVARAFTINAANAGTITNLLGLGFRFIQNLTGGALDDTFTFASNGQVGSLTGRINGGAMGVAGNTIFGDNRSRTFFIRSLNDGDIPTLLPLGFVSIQNLTGGTQSDTFEFVASGALLGTADGGSGAADTLKVVTVSGSITGVVARLTTDSTEGYAGTVANAFSTRFANIDSLVANPDGNAPVDSLFGEQLNSRWDLTTAGHSYQRNGASGPLLFQGFETLVGGALADNLFVRFTDASASGNPLLEAGMLFNGFRGTNRIFVTGSGQRDVFQEVGNNFFLNARRLTFTMVGSASLSGGAGDDAIFIGANPVAAPGRFALTLSGDDGNDRFSVIPPPNILLNIRGGGPGLPSALGRGGAAGAARLLQGDFITLSPPRFQGYLGARPRRSSAAGTLYLTGGQVIVFSGIEYWDRASL